MVAESNEDVPFTLRTRRSLKREAGTLARVPRVPYEGHFL